MAYDLFDFTESLSVAGVPEDRVEHCSLGFGASGECGLSEWSGGFVCHTRSGKPWVFVFGWCDTSGWGCQNGAYVFEYDSVPTREEIEAAWLTELYQDGLAEMLDGADVNPVDVNRYLAGEIDQWGAAP